MSPNSKRQIKNTITGVKHFRCPISKCGGRVPLIPSDIATHLLNNHEQIAFDMHLAERPIGEAYAFFCMTCQSYTNKLHAICHECEHSNCENATPCFISKEDLNLHLKKDHAKWWFELKCKYGKDCHGLYGRCGFVHHDIDKNYIILAEPLPNYLCRYERPWDGMRCRRDQCSFAHLRGRVRFLINTRNQLQTLSTSMNCQPFETQPDFENDCDHVHDDSEHLHDDHVHDDSEHLHDDSEHLHDNSEQLHDDSEHLHDDSEHLHDDSEHLHDDHVHDDSEHLHDDSEQMIHDNQTVQDQIFDSIDDSSEKSFDEDALSDDEYSEYYILRNTECGKKQSAHTIRPLEKDSIRARDRKQQQISARIRTITQMKKSHDDQRMVKSSV